MAGEEDLMKQVEELKRKLREVEEEKEEMRRGWEEEENEEMRRGSREAKIGGESRGREKARGGEYMRREPGTGGIASRAMGSAVHMGQLGMDNNNNDRQFYFPNRHQPQDQRYNGSYSTAPQQQPEFLVSERTSEHPSTKISDGSRQGATAAIAGPEVQRRLQYSAAAAARILFSERTSEHPSTIISDGSRQGATAATAGPEVLRRLQYGAAAAARPPPLL